MIIISSASIDDHVRISISDNGVGIPPEIKHRVFEQFFTTKRLGAGTGQGLALCYDFVVNRNAGEISFESESGEGTIFYIELPAEKSNILSSDGCPYNGGRQ